MTCPPSAGRDDELRADFERVAAGVEGLSKADDDFFLRLDMALVTLRQEAAAGIRFGEEHL